MIVDGTCFFSLGYCSKQRRRQTGVPHVQPRIGCTQQEEAAVDQPLCSQACPTSQRT